jgi:hypothetical protein
LTDTTSVAGRELAIEINTLCHVLLEQGEAPKDVAIALIRVLAHITVRYELGGAEVEKRLAETLSVARARKDAKAKVEAGQ